MARESRYLIVDTRRTNRGGDTATQNVTRLRVPPSDVQAEEHLLGAALLSGEAARCLCEPEDFHKPAHGHIASAISMLVAEGAHVDPGTVASQLRSDGLLEAVGGPAALVSLQAGCPHTGGATKWAQVIAGYARQRNVLSLAGDIAEAVYNGIETFGLVGELVGLADADALGTESSWVEVDMTAVLAGETIAIEPALLARTDGSFLLYPGRVHAFNAESESGKSWLALLACRERLDADEHTLYLDFEDSAGGVAERLIDLGVSTEAITTRFHYVRPDDPIDAIARLRIGQILGKYSVGLAVIDGVTEAMVTSNWSIIDNDDVARFYAALPRILARAGAAVVLIDHVTKDRDTRGRHAIGGQHKLAGIDGAAFSLEVVKPFGRGRDGIAKITVTKDRPGYVRAVAAGGKHVGEMHVRSNDKGVSVVIEAARERAENETFEYTGYMEKISRYLEIHPEPATQREIERMVPGKAEYVRGALASLVERGYVTRSEGGRRAVLHTLVRAYREHQTTEDNEWF